MELKIERLTLKANQRLLVSSDIHGRAEWLRRLLEEAAFSDQDELFILGDLIEKGPNSLECLRYCRELSKRENVHILMGNCDTAWEDVLTDKDCHSLPYMLNRKDSILNEMCALLELPVTPQSDYPALRKEMRAAFSDELSWLAGLPHIIDTDCFTFVHAGIASERLMDNTPWGVMKTDFFHQKCIDEGLFFSKYVVAGHMPTPNYCHSIGDCSPIIDRERKLISIDGGTIRTSGQLNLFSIPGTAPGEFMVYSTDDLEEITVTGTQEASSDPIHLIWTDPFELARDSEDQPVEEGEFTVCFARGRKLLVPKDEIFLYPNGELHCGEATDYFLPVQPGDRVKQIRSFQGCTYCKKDGILGWIRNEYLAL